MDRSNEENEVPLREPEFLGEVPVVNRIDGDPEAGKVVGTARLERLPGGNIIAHIDASGMTGEMLRRGFSIAPGEYSIAEKQTSTNYDDMMKDS